MPDAVGVRFPKTSLPRDVASMTAPGWAGQQRTSGVVCGGRPAQPSSRPPPTLPRECGQGRTAQEVAMKLTTETREELLEALAHLSQLPHSRTRTTRIDRILDELNARKDNSQ